ncbi:MAG: hypothetical protein D6805_09605 [Planctomycetota bacterium]|nr:MAG: hypothetical protein D6805_09605 [Planctomycetota bacterium]
MKKWLAIFLFLSTALYGQISLKQLQPLKQQVQQIRKLPFKQNVAVGVKNKNQLAKYMLQQLNIALPPAKARNLAIALRAFGLIEHKTNLRQVLVQFYKHNTGGFYDPTTKKLFIIQESTHSRGSAVILHELTHALQDQHFNLYPLQRFFQNNDDQSAALSALVEGDATFTMFYPRIGHNLAAQKNLTRTFQLSAELGKEFNPATKNVPAIIQDTILFNYSQGLRFAIALHKKGGYRQINQAFRDPPASTEQILHPEKYLAAKRDEPVVVKLPPLRAFFPPKKGWRRVLKNTMGELGIQILLREHLAYKKLKKLGPLWRLARKYTLLRGLGRTAMKLWTRKRISQAAAGWGGDQYAVFHNPRTKQTSLLWYTYWDSPKDAREFYEIASSIFSRKRTRWVNRALLSHKSVIVLLHIPRGVLTNLCSTLVNKTRLQPFSRKRFQTDFPIVEAIYRLRFLPKKLTVAELEKRQNAILAYAKRAVPYLIQALDAEGHLGFKQEVAKLLKKLTGKNFGTDFKKWNLWWEEQER